MHYLAVYEQLYVARVREKEQTLVDYNAVLLQAFLFALIFWRFLKTEEKICMQAKFLKYCKTQKLQKGTLWEKVSSFHL